MSSSCGSQVWSPAAIVYDRGGGARLCYSASCVRSGVVRELCLSTQCMSRAGARRELYRNAVLGGSWSIQPGDGRREELWQDAKCNHADLLYQHPFLDQVRAAAPEDAWPGELVKHRDVSWLTRYALKPGCHCRVATQIEATFLCNMRISIKTDIGRGHRFTHKVLAPLELFVHH